MPDAAEKLAPPVGRLPGLDAVLAAHRPGVRPLPDSGVDSEGRLIPESPERAASRVAAIRAMLAEIGSATDETDDPAILDAVDRDIDAGRPHRPLFGGVR